MTVYLDGAHDPRYPSDTVAEVNRLTAHLIDANIAQADGFFLNSTLYNFIGDDVFYGKKLVDSLAGRGYGGRHFVVDVSRASRGNVFSYEPQNARGRGLGIPPTARTIDSNYIDAFIWIKPTWQSDGFYGNDPAAGANWFEDPSKPCAPTALYLARQWQTPFNDMPGGAADEAVRQLWGRGIIRGYNAAYDCGPYSFGPNDATLRVQMAALIDRAVYWEREEWADTANKFTDLNQGCVDDTGRRNIRTLAHYNVTQGYGDNTFGPCDNTLNIQVPVFIARAMIAKGKWVQQPDNPAYYPNITDPSLRSALATYIAYAGDVPDRPRYGSFAAHDQPASRVWFARTLWQALNSLPTP